MQEIVKLTLFVSGMTPAALRAISNLKAICSNPGSGQAIDIKVIDIVEHPEYAEQENILATPIVIRRIPPPVRRVIGDLSDEEQVLIGLQLQTSEMSDDGTETDDT